VASLNVDSFLQSIGPTSQNAADFEQILPKIDREILRVQQEVAFGRIQGLFSTEEREKERLQAIERWKAEKKFFSIGRELSPGSRADDHAEIPRYGLDYGKGFFRAVQEYTSNLRERSRVIEDLVREAQRLNGFEREPSNQHSHEWLPPIQWTGQKKDLAFLYQALSEYFNCSEAAFLRHFRDHKGDKFGPMSSLRSNAKEQLSPEIKECIRKA
jgi:hypothetical protein